MQIRLCCSIIGETTQFPITIDEAQLVGELKDAIKQTLQPASDNFAAHSLKLYKVNIDVSTQELVNKAIIAISTSSIEFDKNELVSVWKVSRYFQESGDPAKAIHEETIHILAQLPPGESIDPRASYGYVVDATDTNAVEPPKTPTISRDAPKTPPNHPKHAPPIPFTPTEDVDKKVQIFATGLRTIFEKFLKDDVQLPLWQPPLGLDDEIRRRIADLKIANIHRMH